MQVTRAVAASKRASKQCKAEQARRRGGGGGGGGGPVGRMVSLIQTGSKQQAKTDRQAQAHT